MAIKVVPRIFGIRRSVWIGLGVGLLTIVALGIWLLVAGVSWLWGQVPGAAEAGKRAAGVAIEQVEKSVPGAKEQLGIWLPGVVKEAPAGASEKPETVEQQ
jgi:4-hydroxybenzoate polyprenyltransferase